MSMVYCWKKNESCVKIGKSASETLALLNLTYGEYARTKLSAFEWHRKFKEGPKMCKMTQEVGSQNTKDRCKCGKSTNLGALRSKIRCYLEVLTRLWEYVSWTRPKLWPDKDSPP
jgi:hypothetical protein